MSKLITNTIRHTGGSADNITLDNSGRVGIGETSPDELLHIKSTSVPSIELEQDDGTSYKGLAQLRGNDLEIRGSSGNIEFFTGNNDGASSTERLRIDSSGLVGIGLDSPGSYSSGANNLVVNDASGAGGITIVTPSSDTGSLFFSDGTGATGQGRVRYDHSSDQLTFGTNGTGSRVIIESDGDLKVADGNLVIGTAGHGIDFSAVSHADGMTSELLDSYEDGTYTPQILASGGTSGLTPTYTNQVGRYTKIGNIVQFSAEIDYSAKSGVNSNNTAYITISLPFATRSGSWGNSSIQFNSAIEFDEGSNNVHHNDDGAYLYFWSGLDSGRQDYYPRTSNLHSSGGIYISGTYLST